jgi:uncharacterized protein YegL
MANKKIVNFIVDESGSMSSCRSQVISGFNEFVGDLKREADLEILLSLTKFNTTPTVVYAAKRVQNAPDLDVTNYVPNGGTALLDAVGITVREIEHKVREESDKPTVLCVIMTDGEENASQEFQAEQIRDLIQSKEAEGNWTFVYLGANQDAWKAGAALGVQPQNTAAYKTAETQAAYTSVSNSSSQLFRSGQTQTRSFFPPDKPPKP